MKTIIEFIAKMNFKTNTMSSKYLFCVLILMMLMGCSVDEISEPAFIYIAPVQLSTNPDQGEKTLQSSEVHLFIDGQDQGLYLTGRVYPINVLGSKELNLLGITRILNDEFGNVVPVIYPFWEFFTTTKNLVVGKIDTIYPVLKYNTTSTFGLIENFESGHTFYIDIDKNTNTNVSLSTDNGPTGRYGNINLDNKTNSVFEVENNTKINFKNRPSECYLEFDYLNDIPLSVGFTVYSAGTGSGGNTFAKLTLNPKKVWSHVYLKVSNEVISAEATDISIRLGANMINAAADKGNIKIDNLKLIYK